jgi:hypothetical protein
MKCPTCGRNKRTNKQNARLHLLFTEIAAHVKAKDGLYHPMPWWKVQFKDRWLGYDEFQRSDGTTIYVLKKTSDLDVEPLNEFMMKVEQWANEHGVYLDEEIAA